MDDWTAIEKAIQQLANMRCVIVEKEGRNIITYSFIRAARKANVGQYDDEEAARQAIIEAGWRVIYENGRWIENEED